MFVELPAKKDFAPLGAKQSFRTYGAGDSGDPNSTNMSLLPEQKQQASFLTWRLWDLPPLLQTAMKLLRGTQICAFSVFGLILILSSIAAAQTSTRIKFRRGAVHADVSGTLNSFKSKRTFLIKVRAGQTLKIE